MCFNRNIGKLIIMVLYSGINSYFFLSLVTLLDQIDSNGNSKYSYG